LSFFFLKISVLLLKLSKPSNGIFSRESCFDTETEHQAPSMGDLEMSAHGYCDRCYEKAQARPWGMKKYEMRGSNPFVF
jgi:hypothetical protein